MRPEIIKRIKETVPLSQSAAQILRITANPDHSMRDIVKIVECDTVLTANLLKVANSPAFRPKNEVHTVNMAISYLGERMVVSSALDICSKHFFNAPLKGYLSEQGDLWRHSLQSAIAARELTNYAKTPIDPNKAFTAGILHDIGKVVISTFLEGKMDSVMKQVEENENESYLDAEFSELETDHSEVGAILAEHWKMPEFYLGVIRHHHSPKSADEKEAALTYAVHVGDIIAMMTGAGTGADGLRYQLDPDYEDFLNLDTKNLPEIILTVSEEFEKISSSFENNKPKDE